jgi:GT2 family glycosyltransferase
MDVSIIVVSWNTCDLLRDCLNSIVQQTHQVTFETIVIDNASSDGSANMCVFEFPAVKVIANRQNRGFAAANNQGMQLARGRYTLVLNPDTVILEGAIDRCVAYADAHPDVGVVGCQVLEREGQIQPTSTGFSFPSPWTLFLTLTALPRLFPRSKLFAKPELGWWDRDSERDIDVVTGMFMLVRREAIQQVGMMDESYFIYAEEADWCYRFYKAGWRRVFFPGAKIVHVDGGGKSTSQVNIKMRVQLQKSMMIYYKKNLGTNAWLVAKILYIISNSVRSLSWSIVSWTTRNTIARSKAAAATAALRFHLFGIEPK